MNARRYILSIACITAMCMPFASQLFIHLKISANRNEMLRKMEKETLVHFSIPVANLHWIKPGKEIMIGNRMFDIKKITIHGNMAAVTGLFDDVEKKLNGRLADHQKKNQSLDNLLSQIFSGGYDHSFSKQPDVSVPVIIRTKTISGIPPFYLSAFTEVSAPPPWLV
jgi:hypothetical protein